MDKNRQLVICDPQVDLIGFSSGSHSTFPIEGAQEALDVICHAIESPGFDSRIEGISIIMDSNRAVSIIHPFFWSDSEGNSPPPLTIIRSSDIRARRWFPRNGYMMISRKQDLNSYCLEYCLRLEETGRFPLTIWEENCIIGTRGHNVYPILAGLLLEWEKKHFQNVEFFTKSSSSLQEMHGAFQTEVSPKKQRIYNKALLNKISNAEAVGFCGLYLSHAVRFTIEQAAELLGWHILKKFYLLHDASVSMHPVQDLNFPKITNQWLKEMKAKGLNVVETHSFLYV